jgi:riboflavin synthase
MFTGIVETLSVVKELKNSGTNLDITMQCPITHELKVDQSVAHDGVCLTVTSVNSNENTYTVTAIRETLNRSSLSQWEKGHVVNIERCMPANGRFDGHIVQGHVDCTGTIDEIHDVDGSHLVFISHPENAGITVGKGSVTLNGISLTIVDSFPDAFSVAIIPYTWEHTNLKNAKAGDLVNIEFDIVGKYLQKMQALKDLNANLTDSK